MFKKAFVLVMLAIFLKEALAIRGIGIAPLENSILVSPGEEHITYLLLFNPSDSDANVSLRVYCLNCFRDFEFFGLKGKVNLTQNFVDLPSEVEVEKNTSHMNGKFVEIRVKIPFFVEEQLIFDNKTIPWFGLASDLKELNFSIVASTGEKMQVSLVSRLNVKVKNQSFLWFLLVLAIFMLALLLIKRSRRK
ncbi:MAG: hypothetical protein NZ942_03165 [Candidatus Aenigmarchaeota archaeon]|nr:hypothetical protein [Candidatus Aenigmarchaeota archaeon]